MDPNAERARLNAIEQQMNPYTDPSLVSRTQAEVQKAWNPLLSSATQSTQKQMSDFGQRFYDLTNTGLASGTDAASLTPSQKLAYLQGQLGDMAGQLQRSGSIADYYGGQAKEMAGNSLNAIQFAYNALKDRYNTQNQNYQMALQLAEAEKARRAAAKPGLNLDFLKEVMGGGQNNTPQINYISDDVVNRLHDLFRSTLAQGGGNLSKVRSVFNPEFQSLYNTMKEKQLQLPDTFWDTTVGGLFRKWVTNTSL